MSYEGKRIKEIVQSIYENKIYLPAIQRKFVWDIEQTTDLFDSILKGYPIGTFLFWKLKGDDIKPYTFYSFILHYDVREPFNKTTAKPETKDEILAVLDGQQRLSSLYVALQGTYAYKRPYARWDDDSAFPKRMLYINLLHKPNDDEEEESNYDFRFLTESEAAEPDENEFWFPVRQVFEWKAISECSKYAREKGFLENEIFIDTLNLLWQKFTQENLINYFQIENPDIEEILPIFVRINSGGTPLSKTDLLFSTIVANWQQGREEIESLLNTINKKGHGFYFRNDFIMRSCLALTDSPVLFKVKTFRRENIQKIKDNWQSIQDAIIQSVQLLVEFGFSGETLSSQMAVTPIAYYIYNNGALSNEVKAEIRKYLILSALNRVFSGKPDQVITKIRESIKENGGVFSLEKINEKMDFDKKLVISDDRLEEILSESKGVYTFMVLSLLYPQLKLSQIEFHQDHIHPSSHFDYDTLKNAGLIENGTHTWNDVYYKKDKLPNLQLLEGRENESKNASPFGEWFETNITYKEKYKQDNYIPIDVGLEFNLFHEFYEKRKELLKIKLKELLKFAVSEPAVQQEL
jgi:uncharacterized protein with ParB-like and HNH nuclease domain